MSEPMAVELTHQQNYRHSLGQNSPYFAALKTGTLLGTRCGSCARTFVPPRTHCVVDGSVTAWQTVGDTGTLIAFSEIARRPKYAAAGGDTLTLGLVQIDGVDVAILAELVDSATTPVAALAAGQRVTAAYRPAADHPAQHLTFAAAGAAETTSKGSRR